ncbi:hypothetical protein L208DRAFT_1187294, partial [Tricholoma matsutake]
MAWVDEIVQIKSSVFDPSNQADFILLRTVNALDAAEQYQMPRIQLLHHWSLANPKVIVFLLMFVGLKSILTGSTLYCQCKATGHQNVYQEQQLTTQTRPVVVHNRAADDLVLNTAQMWDAIHVQRFHISSETLDVDNIVHKSAVNIRA